MNEEPKTRPALLWVLAAIGVASTCLAIVNRDWTGGVCLTLAIYCVAKLIRIFVERKNA